MYLQNSALNEGVDLFDEVVSNGLLVDGIADVDFAEVNLTKQRHEGKKSQSATFRF